MNCVTDLHIVHILRHLATFWESFVDAFEVDLPVASIWYAHNTMISFLDVCNRENNIAVTTHLQLASTLLEEAVHMYKRTDGQSDSQSDSQTVSQSVSQSASQPASQSDSQTVRLSTGR